MHLLTACLAIVQVGQTMGTSNFRHPEPRIIRVGPDSILAAGGTKLSIFTLAGDLKFDVKTQSEISSAEFLDTKHVVVGTMRGQVDVISLEPVKSSVLSHHQNEVTDVVVYEGTVISSSMWAPSVHIQQPNGNIQKLEFTAGGLSIFGKRIGFGGRKHFGWFTITENGLVEDHRGKLEGAFCSAINETRLAVGTMQGEVMLIDQEFQPIFTIKAHAKAVSSMAFWGKDLITAGIDGGVFRWSEDGQKTSEWLLNCPVYSVAVGAQGEVFAGCADGVIRRLDGKEVSISLGKVRQCFSDEKNIYALDMNGKVHFAKIQRPQEIDLWSDVDAVAIGSTRKRLTILNKAGELILAGKPVMRVQNQPELAEINGGKCAFVSDGAVFIADLDAKSTQKITLEKYTASLRLSDDGSVLAVAGEISGLRFLDTDTGAQLQRLPLTIVEDVYFRGGKAYCCGTNADNQAFVVMVDLKSGKQTDVYMSRGQFTSITFMEKSGALAVGDGDGNIQLLKGGVHIGVLRKHRARVNTLRSIPQEGSDFILSGSDDTTVILTKH